MWPVTSDMWQVTCNIWHVTHEGRWTFSQNFRSLDHTVWDRRCLEDLEENYELISLMNYNLVIQYLWTCSSVSLIRSNALYRIWDHNFFWNQTWRKKEKPQFFQNSQNNHIDDLYQFITTDLEQVYHCFFKENYRIDNTNA